MADLDLDEAFARLRDDVARSATCPDTAVVVRRARRRRAAQVGAACVAVLAVLAVGSPAVAGLQSHGPVVAPAVTPTSTATKTPTATRTGTATATATLTAPPREAPTATASRSTSEQPTSPAKPDAPRAYLDVTVTQEPGKGPHEVLVSVHLHGLVPQRYVGSTGEAISAKNTTYPDLLWWGDGGFGGADSGDEACHSHAPLVPFDSTWTAFHTYARSGRYQVTFETDVCPPIGVVKRSIYVDVR